MSAPIIKSGSFTALPRSFHLDLGFSPDVFILMPGGIGNTLCITKQSWLGSFQFFSINSAHPTSTACGGITETGVYINTSAYTLSAGTVSYWIALADNGSGFVMTGGYKGDDTADFSRAISTPKKPMFVHVKRDNTAYGTMAMLGVSQAWYHHAVAPADVIQLGASGFAVAHLGAGAADPVNSDGGEGFDWFALADVTTYPEYADYASIQTWTGNGGAADSVSIDFGIAPDTIFVKKLGLTYLATYIKTTDMASTNSRSVQAGSLETNKLRAVTGTSVALGTTVNVDTIGYAALALAESDVTPVHTPRIKTSEQYWLECSSGGVLLPADDTLNFTTSHSWEFLIKADDLPHSATQYIYSRLDATTNNPQVGMALNSTATQLFYARQNGSATWVLGVKFQGGQPVHVLYTFDSVNQIQRVYINGLLRRETEGIGLVNLTADYTITSRGSTWRVCFGGLNDSGSFSNGSNLSFGLARVYARALSASEAEGRYKSAFLNHPDNATDFFEEWSFSEGTGSTVAATNSSPALDGTITNGTWKTRWLHTG